jgi:hypothetical protein
MSVEKVLSMEEFLDYQKQAVEYVNVPGLVDGTFIRIGSVTAGDIIKWSEANEGEAKRTAGLRLIVKSMVDKDNKRIGTDEHIPLLRNVPVKQTEKLLKAIAKLNGMDAKSQEDAKND